MDFPIKHLLDRQASYDELVFLLHPGGLRCPNGHDLTQCYVDKRDRATVVDYRCKICGRRFHAFSGTLWHGTCYCLHRVHHNTPAGLEPEVLAHTQPSTIVTTDEWGAYNHLSKTQRGHATVNHAAHEWARDDDGDGIQEMHFNTAEGPWTGLRNSLRTFRGVNKVHLQQYAAIYAWAYQIKTVTIEFLRARLGVLALERT